MPKICNAIGLSLIIGFTIWALRQWKTEQIEEPEFKISKNSLESEKGAA